MASNELPRFHPIPICRVNSTLVKPPAPVELDERALLVDERIELTLERMLEEPKDEPKTEELDDGTHAPPVTPNGCG